MSKFDGLLAPIYLANHVIGLKDNVIIMWARVHSDTIRHLGACWDTSDNGQLLVKHRFSMLEHWD